MRRPRRNHNAKFKSKVAFAALKGDKTMVELSEQFDVHVNQITEWKNQLLKQAENVFLTQTERRASESGPSVKDLQAKIGQLTMENDFSYGHSLQPGRAKSRAGVRPSARLCTEPLGSTAARCLSTMDQAHIRGSLPHFISSSRGCLALRTEISGDRCSQKNLEDSPHRACDRASEKRVVRDSQVERRFGVRCPR
jgi:transposase